MSVKIITGSIGSGKTRYCTDEMEKLHKLNPNKRCIMIVPSHYSHETERMLITRFGGTGLNNIECTSFEKLSRELLPKVLRPLGTSGKHVLICRAITLTLSELDTNNFDSRLVRAIGKNGFVDVCASLISEMHRYNVTCDDLKEQSVTTENPVLRQKLEILSCILKNYENLLCEREYTDTDDDLSRLSAVIGNSFEKNDYIWIDNFDELLPQQLEVVYALIDSGADITITFTTHKNSENTYYGTKKAIKDVSEYTNVSFVNLENSMSHIKSPDLKFLFGTWFDRTVYDGDCKNAEIYEARDAYTETEHVASKILDLVRESKYRFCDIGIISPQKDSYSHILETVFDEYSIPYYSDESIAISEYPIATQLLSLFDITEYNWDYQSMFSYLRAGFIFIKSRSQNGKTVYKRLNPDDIDLLENYVLKYGIRYKSAWSRSWLNLNHGIIDTAFGNEPETCSVSEKTDQLRELVIAPILRYTEKTAQAKTVSDYCRALFEFLEDINLYQGLKSELLSLAMNSATADSQRFGQIWNLILDVLDQVNSALGDESVTHSEFANYIKTAMTQCRIRTVPSGIDRVFVGTQDMNRAIPTPVVFVMGAVSGTYPHISTSEGFFSNADRETLAQKNLRLAPTTVKRAEKERNTVYKLLSAVTDKLYISYPSMTADGASTLPSQMVSDISHKLKGIKKYDGILSACDDMMYISSPKATLHKFLINPNNNPLWTHVDAWFSEHDEWKNKLFTVRKAKKQFGCRKIELREDIANELFSGKIRYSATRLNSYANCPFSHFLQYGLRAKERDEYEIKPTDTGTYAHEIISRFCKTVDNDPELDWKTLKDEKCVEIVSGIVSDTIDKINSSELRDKEMTADILSRMGDTVTEAAKTVCRSIRCGEFDTDSYEKEITVSLTDNIELGGTIDRLDICRLPDRNDYRIIDYKTGYKEFSVADIYHGLDMQPVIYALAMRMLDDKATVSGMYYSMVHNNFPTIDLTSKESTAMTALKKNTAYNGLTFVGDDKNTPVPDDEINRIESELSRSEGSLFFPGKADKFGYSKYVRTRSEGEWLIEKVRENILNADKDIRGGNIAMQPLTKGQKHACTYCAYADVCNFDGDTKAERTILEKDSEIWEFAEEES